MANSLLQALGSAPQMNGNPIMQIVNMLKNGNNPSAMLNQMAGQNPAIKQAMDMVNGKNPSQMGEMMNNLAQQRGVDLGQLAKSIGMPENVAEQYGIKMQ